MHFLVVDDHRNTRDAIALGLRLLGAEVETAASAAEALRALARRPCEWVICDVRMPGMTGIDLVARIRSLRPAPRVVLMTAYDCSPEEVRRISENGAELLIKPVTAETLVARCRPSSLVSRVADGRGSEPR